MDQALKRLDIQGVLLDSYVAGHYSGIFDHYRVNRVFQAHKNYGFVLGRSLSTSSIYQRFKEYCEKNQDVVTALIEKQTTTPHVSFFFVVVVKVIERTVIFFNDDVHLREILQRAINYINAKFFVCTGLRIQYKFPTYLYFIILGRNIVECHSKHTTVDFRRERTFQSCYQNNINHTCRLGCLWIVIRILFLKTKTSNDTVS